LQILGEPPGAGAVGNVEVTAQLPVTNVPNGPATTTWAENTLARDMPRRRRQSSNVMRSVLASPHSELQNPDRLSRSFTPMPNFGRAWTALMGDAQTPFHEEEEGDDILGFWSRVPRSITSDDDVDGAAGSDEVSDWSTEEEADEDEDDDDGDDIELFGHR
jgi:hypothetical protein